MMKPTHRTAFLFAGIASVGVLVGARYFICNGSCCGAKNEAAAATIAAKPTTPPPQAPTLASVATLLPPESAVDSAFDGCKASCGSHSPALRATARTQPGANVNDVVFCPVSGAVFKVKEDGAKREVAGKSLYFCCPMCAAYFDSHRVEILSARGIAPTA